MVKTLSVVVAVVALCGGCTREVYLQSVPCVEGECQPCYVGQTEVCPEVEMQTVRQTFEVYDVSAQPAADCRPCANVQMRCQTVCQ